MAMPPPEWDEMEHCTGFLGRWNYPQRRGTRPTATNGVNHVRKLQRALYRTSKQDKKRRFYSLYDKVWRADVLWEAWRQVKANKGAPSVDGMAIEWIINTGYEEEMIHKLHEALREQRYQFAPVPVVE